LPLTTNNNPNSTPANLPDSHLRTGIINFSSF
jgi:hypothetical protein